MTVVDENQNRRWTFCRPIEPAHPERAPAYFCDLGTLWCEQTHPDDELLKLRVIERERARQKQELLEWARAEALVGFFFTLTVVGVIVVVVGFTIRIASAAEVPVSTVIAFYLAVVYSIARLTRGTDWSLLRK